MNSHHLYLISLSPDILSLSGVSVNVGTILLLFSLLVLLFSMLFSVSERMRNKRMLQQKGQIISDVFTKVTHELRAPLTVILGLSKQLREQKDLSDGNLATYLNAIERQGRNLSKLVNQLLDIANLQTSDKTVEWKTGNIVAFVEMMSETFRIYARQKGVELYFFSDETEVEIDFVPDYLNKILYNLLSNAVKYSEEGTRINLVMERNKKDRQKIAIKVIDQGRGISKEALPHIFDLFYKYPHNNTETSGNGIGLTIVKQITEGLGGTIRVESEVGKGTVFTVELPFRRNEKQLYTHWIPEKNTPRPVPQAPLLPEANKSVPPDPGGNDPRTTILLVEDNKDIFLYVRSIFHEKQYNILYAPNVEKAWDMVNKQLPDIVITDVIMPQKSGIELCREMKASPLLNHIPIVIVSAKNEEADLIEGLRSGADCYIRKPFYPEALQVRVENLLKTRLLLKEKYCRTVLKEEKEELNDNTNTDFLRRVTDIIYREMKNPDFTAGKLAAELAISVSQLNKKLNIITGYPSSTYILQVKLRHAKKIFASQNKTIGEVSTECGIYDVNYFSRIFKKHTGVTPTQFKRLPQI
ncbi:MAG TPA: response regulator [Petrimonas sp.]|uniref:hybrid sensor histidine kinase/response regulator transcription factor n=1 Tax=Petrimonas sp. TaxID=2023866 RepID=UPI00177648D8|nr:response regulator [Petrimonas sp.]